MSERSDTERLGFLIRKGLIVSDRTMYGKRARVLEGSATFITLPEWMQQEPTNPSVRAAIDSLMDEDDECRERPEEDDHDNWQTIPEEPE